MYGTFYIQFSQWTTTDCCNLIHCTETVNEQVEIEELHLISVLLHIKMSIETLLKS